MNRLALSLPAVVAAFAIAAAPVASAQSVTDKFKTELAAKVGSKTGKGAAKAAAKTLAKYVVAVPKGDPKKFASFTGMAIKAIKGRSADTFFVNDWSNFSVKSYFKKGIKQVDVKDSKFKAALKKVYKLVKNDETAAQAGFEVLKKTTKVTGSDLGTLADEVSKAAGVPITS